MGQQKLFRDHLTASIIAFFKTDTFSFQLNSKIFFKRTHILCVFTYRKAHVSQLFDETVHNPNLIWLVAKLILWKHNQNAQCLKQIYTIEACHYLKSDHVFWPCLGSSWVHYPRNCRKSCSPGRWGYSTYPHLLHPSGPYLLHFPSYLA